MKTFVFTDIVRSVDLKGQMVGSSDAERDAAFIDTILTPHREHIEIGLSDAGGRVVSTAGDGHFLVFDNPMLAAGWAVDVQRRHRDRPITTPHDTEVQARIGLHVGFPQADPDDPHNFVGKAVDYAARLTDLATAGQVLVSAATLGLLRDGGLDGIGFHSHGDHLLRGIGSVEVHELLYDGDQPRPLKADAANAEELATDVLPVDESAPEAASATQPLSEQRDPREWTVLPPTMGLTEFSRQKKSGGSSGAAVKPPPVRTLGNYELGELLGAGGMGNVYRARHRQFDRTRAIKIIKPHLVDAGHEEVIRRFYREIKAIGRLDHPNIVVAIDSSAPDADTHYLVMEYIDGVSSEQLISRRRTLGVADACEIVRQAAVGLEYIHRQGMVHRDIKPSNLMLTDAEASTLSAGALDGPTRRPLVKILDLGLALLVTDDQPRFTRFDHGAMGTAMYMSPEQWVTTSVDIRSDIYSLGCTLYHLLTGRPPYYDSDFKPQRAHERAPTPSVSREVNAPAELDAVLTRMMAKTPDERYPRPAEVAEALAPFCAESDLLALVEQSRRGASAKTEARAHGETLPTGQPVSDTFGPLPSRPIPMPTTPPARGTSAPSPLRRWLTPVAITAVVGLVLWMGYLVRAQRERLRESSEKTLVVAARSAARELAGEIDKRFATLLDASRMLESTTDPGLRAALRTLKTSATPPPAGYSKKDRAGWKPTNKQLEAWAPLQAWLTEQKADSLENEGLSARSWFITDRFGRQVARRPVSESIGAWYHDRPYFLAPGATPEDPAPITEAHLSAAYISFSTGKLKVAFSVPILDEEEQVLGVLAMSLNLGDFVVLEDDEWAPEPLEVVLVDLRDDKPKQRGLLLHHPDLGPLEDPNNPFRLSDPLLKQIDQAQATRGDGRVVRGYADLLQRAGRGKSVGALEDVVIRGADERREDTGWLVIVQQEM